MTETFEEQQLRRDLHALAEAIPVSFLDDVVPARATSRRWPAYAAVAAITALVAGGALAARDEQTAGVASGATVPCAVGSAHDVLTGSLPSTGDWALRIEGEPPEVWVKVMRRGEFDGGVHHTAENWSQVGRQLSWSVQASGSERLVFGDVPLETTRVLIDREREACLGGRDLGLPVQWFALGLTSADAPSRVTAYDADGKVLAELNTASMEGFRSHLGAVDGAFGYTIFTTAEHEARARAAARAARERLDKPAPEIDATTRDGAEFNLSDHAGTPVVLAFVATWCGPCSLDAVAGYLSNGATVVAVVGPDDPNDVEPWLEGVDPRIIVIEDPRAEISERYGVTGYPHVVLIDEAGRVQSESATL